MAGLEINLRNIESDDRAMVAEMSGAIDGTTVVTFQEALEQITQQDVSKLVLDMSQVRYVNSTGLGSLVKYADKFRSAGGGMALIRVPAKVKIVIEMLGLHAFFEICPDEETALKALSGSAGAAEAAASKPTVSAKPVEKGEKPRRPAVKKPASAKVSFPYHMECSSCGVTLELEEPGNFKCPRCYTFVTVSAEGNVTFRVPESPPPLELALRFDKGCAEALESFVGVIAGNFLNGGGGGELGAAINQVFQVLEERNDSGAIFHVSIDTGGQGLRIKIAHHGKAIAAGEEASLFPLANAIADEFECLPHPKAGNIITLVKN